MVLWRIRGTDAVCSTTGMMLWCRPSTDAAYGATRAVTSLSVSMLDPQVAFPIALRALWY
eukprot:1559505-Rhodomonas_salina.1